jgi:hypothetical protein
VAGRSGECGSFAHGMCFRFRFLCLVVFYWCDRSFVLAWETLVSAAVCVCSVELCDIACVGLAGNAERLEENTKATTSVGAMLATGLTKRIGSLV